jgi:hypothetical protein
MGHTSWSHTEMADIRHYCLADVDATVGLLRAMDAVGELVWPYSLLRGRYTAAVARMERAGVPLDTATLECLLTHWSALKRQLIGAIDLAYGVYENTTFKGGKFAAYLEREGISYWPVTETGKLSLEDDTFRDMAKLFPQLTALKELRCSLSEMRLSGLTVGADGRNRCLLSPYATKTGRNAPSNTKFVFGPAVWMRSLIQPPEGYGLAYIDWRAQEVALAAALFDDPRLIHDYLTGDVYLTFAKDAGLVPRDATKESHSAFRDLIKLLFLALNYGGGDKLLSQRLGVGLNEAARLRQLH